MYHIERIQNILDIAKKEGRLKVSDLSEKFDVSEVTIRKDLNVLENQGYIERTFGGAVYLGNHVKEKPLSQKKEDNISNKKEIARQCEKFLENGMDVFLDAGSTSYLIAEKIAKFNNMKVITYDLEIALLLSKYENIKVYIIGGYIERNNNLALSLEGYMDLKNIHVDISFIGTDAFDIENAYSNNDIKANVKRIMTENSKISILAADSSKFMKSGLFSIGSIFDYDYIITDKLNKKLNEFLENRKG